MRGRTQTETRSNVAHVLSLKDHALYLTHLAPCPPALPLPLEELNDLVLLGLICCSVKGARFRANISRIDPENAAEMKVGPRGGLGAGFPLAPSGRWRQRQSSWRLRLCEELLGLEQCSISSSSSCGIWLGAPRWGCQLSPRE